MEKIDSIAGKLLYAIYVLSQTKQLTTHQKNHLKDLVIQDDDRLKQLIYDYLKNKNILLLNKHLLQLSTEESAISDDCASQTSKYKYRRPSVIQLPNKAFQLQLRKFSQRTSEKSLDKNHCDTFES